MKNSEIVWIGNKPVGGCIACQVCAKKGQCVFDDIVNEVREKAYQAAVVSARRAGTTATFDQINKYFTIQEMPVVSSRYWNMVHGAAPEDVKKDLEGWYTMRVLGRNMAHMHYIQGSFWIIFRRR